MRRTTKLTLLALSTLLLTGCGAQKNATYDDANEMREAVEASGVDCGDAEQSTGSDPGTTSVMCDEKVLLTVISSDGTAQEMTDLMEELNLSYLRGGNWIASTGYLGRLEEIQKGIGGDLTRVS